MGVEKVIFWVSFGVIVAIIAAGLGGLIAVPILQYPQNMQNNSTPTFLKNFLIALGFPEQIASWWPILLVYGLVPLTAVFAIFYGFLSELGIFKITRWVNWFIAIAGTLSLLPIGWFTILISILFGFMSIYAVGVFALLFFVGVFLIARGRYYGWGAEQAIASIDKKIGDLQRERTRVQNNPKLSDAKKAEISSRVDAKIADEEAEKEYIKKMKKAKVS